jgi:ketosteroid isomerase-like protein
MFTKDAKSMEPNEPSFIGRKKIEIHFADIMNAGDIKLEVTTIGLWGDEKMIAEEGGYTFTDKDGNELDKGKYITLWKKENNKWKLFRDCVNSDLPIQSSK